jgi:monoamine oxidase
MKPILWLMFLLVPGASLAAPRVVVVGGGIAGLTALHELEKQCVAADLYTDSQRVGGRIHSTLEEEFGTKLVVNHGAELIDSTHTNLLALIRELGLRVVEREEQDFESGTFFYRGRPLDGAEVEKRVLKEGPALRKIARDQDRYWSEMESHERRPGRLIPVFARRLDSQSLRRYLRGIGAGPFLRAYLEAAAVSESGVEAHRLSALSLFDIFRFEPEGKEMPEFLYANDELYRVEGGTQRVTDALWDRHRSRIHLGHRLRAVKGTGAYELQLETESGQKTLTADHVVLAIPTFALRSVPIEGLPPEARKAVKKVNYGRHTKLFLFFRSRPWLEQQHTGDAIGDAGFQLWDSSQGQPGRAGSLTVYLGARGPGEVDREKAQKMALALLEKRFPGIRGEFLGSAMTSWRQSYTGSPLVGERSGVEQFFGPVGNINFAGESFSKSRYGYMDGAVETGRDAALRIVQEIKASDRWPAGAWMRKGCRAPAAAAAN